MRSTSCSHSSTGARATGWRSVAQCSSVRLRRSTTVWRSTSGTPTSVGRLPRCRARRPSRSAFRTRRSTVGCPRRVARPHLPRRSRRRRRLTGVRLAGVEPYRYGMSQGADLVYVWFIAARAAMNGPSATVGMVHADGPAHGDRPRLERERDAAHLTGPRARGSTRASNSGTDSCPGAPHTHGTVNAACGWRTCVRSGACGPFFGSEGRIRCAGRQGRRPTGRGRHLRQRPASRTSADGGWFVSDAFRLAGLRRSVPHLSGGGDGWPRVECAGCALELVHPHGVGVARPIHRRIGGDTVVTLVGSV